jgi:hypothetical protein
VDIFWQSFSQILPQEKEEIAIYSNSRKCGLQYHLNCINYGKIELVTLLVNVPAIFPPIYSQAHAVLMVLFSILPNLEKAHSNNRKRAQSMAHMSW